MNVDEMLAQRAVERSRVEAKKAEMLDMVALFEEAAALAQEKHDLEAQRKAVQVRQRDVIRRLRKTGHSVRETAALLHLSPGRITQIEHEED